MMKQLCKLESVGQGGSFEFQILIESEKYDSLSKDNKFNISFEGNQAIESLIRNINMAWAKENEQADREKHITELTDLFISAGFEPVYVEVIDNQYCSNACCYKFPWIVVTTEKGRITLGWRKRVMNLDWTDSIIEADGRELFKGEHTTIEERYIHCWGKEKAIEYLKKLADTHRSNLIRG